MSDIFCKIDLADIDFENKKYLLDLSDQAHACLTRAIKETGFTIPPVVKPSNHKYVIISGFNRIRAVTKLNIGQIWVQVLSENVSDPDCAKIAIASLSFKRPLMQVELIRSVNLLKPFLNDKQIATMSKALFNASISTHHIASLSKIGKLPDPALKLIQNRRLSIKAAKVLTQLDDKTAAAYMHIFGEIKASASKQHEIITCAKEIAAANQTTPHALLISDDIMQLIHNKDVDSVSRADQLRHFLFTQRYPELARERRRINDLIAALNFSTWAKITPPKYFESPYYQISFKVKNLKEYVKKTTPLLDKRNIDIIKDILGS